MQVVMDHLYPVILVAYKMLGQATNKVSAQTELVGDRDEERSCDGCGGGAGSGGGGERWWCVCGVLRRSAAEAVRPSADDGRVAHSGVLLQHEGAAELPVPVRQKPSLRTLCQHPHHAQDHRRMRHLATALQLITCLLHPSLYSASCTVCASMPWNNTRS